MIHTKGEKKVPQIWYVSEVQNSFNSSFAKGFIKIKMTMLLFYRPTSKDFVKAVTLLQICSYTLKTFSSKSQTLIQIKKRPTLGPCPSHEILKQIILSSNLFQNGLNRGWPFNLKILSALFCKTYPFLLILDAAQYSRLGLDELEFFVQWHHEEITKLFIKSWAISSTSFYFGQVFCKIRTEKSVFRTL